MQTIEVAREVFVPVKLFSAGFGDKLLSDGWLASWPPASNIERGAAPDIREAAAQINKRSPLEGI